MKKKSIGTISIIASCLLLLGIVSMFAPTHISFDARGAEILLDGSIVAEGSFTLEGYILHNPFQGDAFTLKDFHAPNLDARVIDVSHTLGPAYPIENHHLVPGIMEVRNQNDNYTSYNSFYIFSESYDFWIVIVAGRIFVGTTEENPNYAEYMDTWGSIVDSFLAMLPLSSSSEHMPMLPVSAME